MAIKGAGQTAKDNITPDFLRSAENLNSDQSSDAAGDTASSQAEQGENVGGWADKTTGMGGGSAGLSGSKAKMVFKKFGPAGGLIGLLFGAMFGLNSLTVLMPFHLGANMLDKLNSQDTSIRLRTNSITKRLLNGKKMTTGSATKGGKAKYRSVPLSLEKKMKANGITLDTDSNGKIRNLVFESGGKKTMVPPGEFDSFRAKNTAFNKAYTNSTRTKFGSFVDSIANKFFSAYGIDRNRYADWDSDASSEKKKASLLEKIKEATSGKSKSSIDMGEYTPDEESGEDKRTSTTPVHGDDIETGTGKTKQVGDALKGKAASVAGAGNLVCGFMNGVATVGILAAGIEAGRLIALVASYLEAVDKVKSGESDGAPIHEWANLLTEEHYRTDVRTTSAEEQASAATNLNVSGGSDKREDTSDYEIDYSTTKTTEKKSAMEAHGILWLVAGSQVPANDPSTIKFSVESSAGFIGSMLKASVNYRTICGVTSIVSGIVSGILTFFPPGAGLVLKTILKAGAAVGTGAILGAALGIILPTIAQKIAVDYVTDALGEDLGSALAAGGSKDMKTIHQNGGGGPSGLAETEAYYVETQKVIAEYAEIERLEKSPFDATSKYTFLGSIVGKLVPYATQASTISSTLTSIGSIFSRSLSSMLPSAMALDSLELRRNLGNCPFLEDIGVVGDAYCMPYMTNDLSTIDKDPEEVLQMMIDWGDVTCGAGDPNCDKDDSSPKIVDKIQDYSDNNPNLSGYINFCLNRTAPFGQNDASIPAVIAGTSTGNAGLDGALNAAPIIGDIIDVIDGWSTIQSQGIAIGESCTYSPKNTSKLNERLPYYAQFVTDERVMEIITDCEYRSIVGEYLGSECTPLEEGDSGGLKTGGLTLKEAEDFFKPYVEHRTTNYPSGCPNAVQHWDNCSSVPTWFINDHTTLNTHVTANGNETANRTISENPDKFKMSDLSDSPSPYSIAQSTSAAASPNHTYMVVGVTSSKMIILEAGCGNGPSFTRAKEVDLSYGNGYKFLDISKFVKK